jgi:general secretion pathway protein C
MKRLPILLSLLALVLLSASIAYWILQLYQPPQRPIAAPPQAVLPEPAIDAAATLFGGQAAAVATNYTLTGIVADGRDSVAIIVAEGSPPKALKVGKEVAPGVTVAEVHPRYVMLSDSGVMKRIDLPSDTKPAGAQAAAAAPAGGEPPGGEPPVSPGPVQQATETPAPETPPPSAAASPAPAPNVAPAVPGAPAPVRMAPPTTTISSPVRQTPQVR